MLKSISFPEINWRAKFRDPALESEYTESRLPFEKVTAKTLILTVLCQDLLTFPYDFAFQKPIDPERMFALIMSCGMVMSSVIAIVISNRIVRSDPLRQLISIWAFALITFNSLMTMFGPTPSGGLSVIFGVSSVIAYVLPIALRFRISIGVSLVLGFLVPYLFRVPCDGRMIFELFVGYLSANIIGAITSHRFSMLGRSEYAARRREIDAKNELEIASREINRLEGLLPICAHCKKIRDEAGEWQVIETYLRERTEAKFSHGICPGCLKTHYDMDMETVTQP